MGATLCSHRVNLVSVMTFMAAAMLFVMMMVMARRHDPGNWTIFRIPTHRRIHRSGNRAARTFHKLLIADVLLERLSMRKAVYVLVNMIRYMSCMGRMNFRNYIFTRFFSLLYFLSDALLPARLLLSLASYKHTQGASVFLQYIDYVPPFFC